MTEDEYQDILARLTALEKGQKSLKGMVFLSMKKKKLAS